MRAIALAVSAAVGLLAAPQAGLAGPGSTGSVYTPVKDQQTGSDPCGHGFHWVPAHDEGGRHIPGKCVKDGP